MLASATTSSVRLAARSSMPRGVAHFNHASPRHLPFGFANKAAFRAKYAAFIGLGFALPFVASYWQLRKSAGAA